MSRDKGSLKNAVGVWAASLLCSSSFPSSADIIFVIIILPFLPNQKDKKVFDFWLLQISENILQRMCQSQTDLPCTADNGENWLLNSL